MADQFVDWHPGDPPLPPAQHAANLRAIWNRVTSIFEAGGFDRFVSYVQSADLRKLTLTTASGFTASATLPPGPFNPAGERVVAKRYEVDDLITVSGSSYITLLPHVASVAIATDLAAGRLQLVAAKGRDSENVRGQHQPGQAYATNDVVYTGTPGFSEVVYWKAFMDVPVDGPLPGDFPWAQVSVEFYVERTIDVDGKPAAGAVLHRYTAPRETLILGGLPNCVATLDVAAQALTTFTIKVDAAVVGTFKFAAGAKIATFATASQYGAFMAPGQRLTVVAPATQDAAASGLSVTLTLNR